MEDFNQTLLHDAIRPTLFEMADSTKRYDYMIASITTTDFSHAVSSVEQTWKSLIRDTPFEYSFVPRLCIATNRCFAFRDHPLTATGQAQVSVESIEGTPRSVYWHDPVLQVP